MSLVAVNVPFEYHRMTFLPCPLGVAPVSTQPMHAHKHCAALSTLLSALVSVEPNVDYISRRSGWGRHGQYVSDRGPTCSILVAPILIHVGVDPFFQLRHRGPISGPVCHAPRYGVHNQGVVYRQSAIRKQRCNISRYPLFRAVGYRHVCPHAICGDLCLALGELQGWVS